MTQWLTDTFVWTGGLIALVLLLRRPVARHFGAQVAYALWALPLVRLVLPPLVLPASLAPIDPVAPAANLASAGDPLLVLAGEVTPAAPAAPGFDWLALLLALWLGGALTFLAWRWHQYRTMRADLLAEARPVGEVGRVRLVETPAVSAPVAFGVADKVVALPPLFMAQPDRAARDLAIAHELAHHRGHDLLANILAQPLLALHWFNPLAWLGWRAMRRDQEAACDARVVAGREAEEKATYARVIAGFATGRHLALAAPMACPMASPLLGEKSIIHRLRSLTMADVSAARRKLGLAAIAGTALVALPLTASISYAQPEVPAVPDAPQPRQTERRMVIIDNPAGSTLDDPSLHTREVRRPDGTTVILRTTRPVSEEEAQQRVDQAFATMPDETSADGERTHRRVVIREGDDLTEIEDMLTELEALDVPAVDMAEALAGAREGMEEARRALADQREAMREQRRVVILERQARNDAKASAALGLREAQQAIREAEGLSPAMRQRILRDLQNEIERMEREEVSHLAPPAPPVPPVPPAPSAPPLATPVAQVRIVPPGAPVVKAPQPPRNVAKPARVRVVIDGAFLLSPLPLTVTAS